MSHPTTSTNTSLRQQLTRRASPTTTTRPATSGASSGPQQPVKRKKHTQPISITDDFSDLTIDPLIWGTWSQGTGASAVQQNGVLDFSIGADATFESQFHTVGISVGTKCKFPGDFDARVDYALLRWPSGNGASVSLVAYQAGPVDEISRTTTSQWGDIYNSWPGRGAVALADQSGSLRIVRSNDIVRTFLWHDGEWKELSSQTIAGQVWVGMTLSASAETWQRIGVSASFDHFAITALDATCPAGSDPRNR